MDKIMCILKFLSPLTDLTLFVSGFLPIVKRHFLLQKVFSLFLYKFIGFLKDSMTQRRTSRILSVDFSSSPIDCQQTVF